MKESELALFREAVNGERGQLDAWLELNNEAEVRAAIKALVRAEITAAQYNDSDDDEEETIVFAGPDGNWYQRRTVTKQVPKPVAR